MNEDSNAIKALLTFTIIMVVAAFASIVIYLLKMPIFDAVAVSWFLFSSVVLAALGIIGFFLANLWS